MAEFADDNRNMDFSASDAKAADFLKGLNNKGDNAASDAEKQPPPTKTPDEESTGQTTTNTQTTETDTESHTGTGTEKHTVKSGDVVEEYTTEQLVEAGKKLKGLQAHLTQQLQEASRLKKEAEDRIRQASERGTEVETKLKQVLAERDTAEREAAEAQRRAEEEQQLRQTDPEGYYEKKIAEVVGANKTLRQRLEQSDKRLDTLETREKQRIQKEEDDSKQVLLDQLHDAADKHEVAWEAVLGRMYTDQEGRSPDQIATMLKAEEDEKFKRKLAALQGQGPETGESGTSPSPRVPTGTGTVPEGGEPENKPHLDDKDGTARFNQGALNVFRKIKSALNK